MYKKTESESLTKSHFASIHSRVQNKYEQMQKRLEKSKSLDSLTMLNDDFLFVQVNKAHDETNVHTEKLDGEKKQPVTLNVIVEEVQNNISALQEATESYLSPSELDKNIEKFFHNNDFISESLESLNEIPNENTEYEDSLPSSSPTPKISIRDRIESRISAAREKRRDKNKKEQVKKDSRQKVEKLILSNTTKQEAAKVFKKTKLGTVTIALIESTGLDTDPTDERTRMLFCRFRLGSEKFKSKPVRINASSVKWQELFNINLYDENILEVSLWDKDIFLGRNIIDLSETEREKTHKMRLDLVGAAKNIELFILLTISGINLENAVLDFDDYDRQHRRNTLKRKAWYRLRDDYSDVGCLCIFVYGAKGLAANDCYCVLELNNDRLQTQTEFKTNDPNWMKVFSLTVTDITSILEITVIDEKKSEIVGKISIPLLKVNNGQKKWYALKDSTQRERAKGNNPRILLEMRLTWNLARASIRVIHPKEVKYLQPVDKLDRHIFTKNLSRAKAVITWILDAFKVLKTCFEWESRRWNITALTVWLVMCSIFRVWMLPLLLLVPFLWYRPENYFLIHWRKYLRHDKEVAEEQKNEREEKTSLRQKINSLQEMVQYVQNYIGVFASYGENIKNLFNFTVPFLSFLTIGVLLVVALLMFLIPVKYMFMFWGIHKFTRKIIRPNRIPNNEILDLLSRVPDDETLLDCQELPLDETSDDNIK